MIAASFIRRHYAFNGEIVCLCGATGKEDLVRICIDQCRNRAASLFDDQPGSHAVGMVRMRITPFTSQCLRDGVND